MCEISKQRYANIVYKKVWSPQGPGGNAVQTHPQQGSLMGSLSGAGVFEVNKLVPILSLLKGSVSSLLTLRFSDRK